jgi:hypothetical protein
MRGRCGNCDTLATASPGTSRPNPLAPAGRAKRDSVTGDTRSKLLTVRLGPDANLRAVEILQQLIEPKTLVGDYMAPLFCRRLLI